MELLTREAQPATLLKDKWQNDQAILPIPVGPDSLLKSSELGGAFKRRLATAPEGAQTLLSSSMAEHSAVNRRVVGSSPT